MKTYALKKDEIQNDWWVVDAEGQTLGRLATRVVTLLRGKHKPSFSTNLDNGDFVIVINAEKIKVTGKKLDEKKYYAHSLYPGGLREVGLREQLAKHPDRVIKAAVKGMLPDNRMSHKLIGKLKVYRAAEHPHGAQNPKVWKIEEK